MKLTVKPLKQKDAGRGLAAIDRAAMAEMDLENGDYTVIEGSDGRAVARVWPGYPEDEGSGIIRIDGRLRQEAEVGIDDRVEVEPADVKPAKSVTVALPQNLRIRGNVGPHIRDKLGGQAVTAGQTVPFSLGLGPLSSMSGQKIPLRIAATDPDGTVVVTDSTEIEISERPAEQLSETDGVSETPSITYEDIGGLDEELEQVREMIELPLSEPELFRKLGIEPPSGVLLYGPPGTGKTLIAEAVANEVDAGFEVIDGPEIVSKYKGESEEKLRETFERAVERSPAVVFIDEIDSIAAARDAEADMENRVVAQLLTLMDGLESGEEVIVIGATNRVDVVDPALRRGGRFDREIEIGVPDEAGRREILDVHARGMPLADDVDLDDLAARTYGFVGADIHSLTTEAAMRALRDRDDRDELHVGRSDFEAALAAVDPSAMREYVAETPTVSYDDVGGLEEAKQVLTEAVEWPLAYSPLFEETNTEPPSGVLLHGPPGTGKTLLARALAGESNVNFVSVAGPELLDKYVGESEKAVREVFDRARQTAPAVVFFDEIDGIASQRVDSNEVTERVVSQLLTELDSAAENPDLIVLAATNRKEVIDPALLRPGRLERHVEVPDPDEAARREIFAVHTDGKPLGEDVDLDGLAADTENFSGAQVEALVREASMRAISDVATDATPEEASDRADEVTIRREDFEAAMDVVADE